MARASLPLTRILISVAGASPGERTEISPAPARRCFPPDCRFVARPPAAGFSLPAVRWQLRRRWRLASAALRLNTTGAARCGGCSRGRSGFDQRGVGQSAMLLRIAAGKNLLDHVGAVILFCGNAPPEKSACRVAPGSGASRSTLTVERGVVIAVRCPHQPALAVAMDEQCQLFLTVAEAVPAYRAVAQRRQRQRLSPLMFTAHAAAGVRLLHCGLPLASKAAQKPFAARHQALAIGAHGRAARDLVGDSCSGRWFSVGCWLFSSLPPSVRWRVVALPSDPCCRRCANRPASDRN